MSYRNVRTSIYSRLRLIRPMDNWASCLIRHNSSTYFETELIGAHVKWSGPLNWAMYSSTYFKAELSEAHCINPKVQKTPALKYSRHRLMETRVRWTPHRTRTLLLGTNSGKKVNLNEIQTPEDSNHCIIWTNFHTFSAQIKRCWL